MDGEGSRGEDDTISSEYLRALGGVTDGSVNACGDEELMTIGLATAIFVIELLEHRNSLNRDTAPISVH